MFALIFLCYFLCIKTKKVNRDIEYSRPPDVAKKQTEYNPLHKLTKESEGLLFELSALVERFLSRFRGFEMTGAKDSDRMIG